MSRRTFKTSIAQDGYRQLVQDWRGCQRCPLSARRSNIVHLRGIIPAPVLFVSEAPGRTEDLLGAPFVGAAGRDVFNPLLTNVWQRLGYEIPFAVTNIVACMPEQDNGEWIEFEDDGHGNPAKQWIENWELRPPEKTEAAECRPRLLQTIQLCQPKVIILMGNIAARDFRPLQKHECHGIPLLGIYHPAHIIYAAERQSITPESTYEFKRASQMLAHFFTMHHDLIFPGKKVRKGATK